MGMASPPNTIEDAIDQLRGNMPDRERMSIQNNGSSHRIALMASAIEKQGLDGSETVDQWYFEDRGLVVVDLREGSIDE
jgi:hypothetical protein